MVENTVDISYGSIKSSCHRLKNLNYKSETINIKTKILCEYIFRKTEFLKFDTGFLKRKP
jgi:hypothetical protein